MGERTDQTSEEKMTFHYNKEQMIAGLRQIGLKKGDIVFSHSNVGFFGFPEEGISSETVFDVIFDAFMEVIGEEGTLIVPTYTYSFPKLQPYNLDNTVSTCGVFTENFRKLPLAYRSLDPIFSVAAIGPMAHELLSDLPVECLGPDSFFD